jgi:GNAT superfamily N-acetyltransferase
MEFDHSHLALDSQIPLKKSSESHESRSFNVESPATQQDLERYLWWREVKNEGQPGPIRQKVLASQLPRQAERHLQNLDRTEEYFTLTQDDQIIAGGDIKIFPYNKQLGPKVGMLYNVHVEDAFRGQGLAQKITNARIEWARNHGLEWVMTRIAADNFASMSSKFKDGFIVSGVSINSEGITENFNFIKSLSAPDNSSDAASHQTINLKDGGNLKKAFEEGWVGEKLEKNEDKKDDWSMVLRK